MTTLLEQLTGLTHQTVIYNKNDVQIVIQNEVLENGEIESSVWVKSHTLMQEVADVAEATAIIEGDL